MSAAAAVVRAAPPATGVPPQLGAGLAAPAGAGPRPRPDGPSGPAGSAAPSGLLHDLAGYAGLYQRVFVGLLMAWTLLVALGIAL